MLLTLYPLSSQIVVRIDTCPCFGQVVGLLWLHDSRGKTIFNWRLLHRMQQWWLHGVCRLRGVYVGRVYLWVAAVGLGHVVDQPQKIVQPQSACNDGFFVRSVSKRIGILGNARSGAEVCVDGVGKFFLFLLKLLVVLLLRWLLLFLPWHYSSCPLIGFPCFLFVPVDLFTTDVPRRRRYFDLRGVLLHVEFLPTAPQPIGVVCVADVVFNVNV